ncbi:F390 synthetase-related protein [Neisseria sp. Ec49-e6-T10]|uniref:F390 synthetase-related protein n=1 Tax=Neisseria sp. Ec49-e6-T10 TaxID=3140744 RepID=UPI003EBA501C
MSIFNTIWHYWRTKQLQFSSREALEQYQIKKLDDFKQYIVKHSPYFRQFQHLPISQWPIMNKASMMDHFDQMNTKGLCKKTLLACAQKSERSRDFSPKVGQYSVGLSSGTSGQRGLFVVSPKEQHIWAGGVLAKMLPQGLFAGERVALFLRADNNLYHSVNNRWLSLSFFDLLANFSDQLSQLETYQPTIIVAPAQVLRALALAKLHGELRIKPKKVISAAETMEAHDKALLQRVFSEVSEVYQATEGFIAATCTHGTLHLNEEFIHVEPQWLDKERFMPIITDFTRTTQPIIRYRLDDVLVQKNSPCPCGSKTRAIAYIEGRHDDQLLLDTPNGQKQIIIFADPCSRIIANSLPLSSDYRLVQNKQTLQLIATCSEEWLENCQQQLCAYFKEQGADVSSLHWVLESVLEIDQPFLQKRRRITRQSF